MRSWYPYSWTEEGWALSERMTAKLVINALQMAIWRCKLPHGVIIHSDRGSQYVFTIISDY